MAHFSEPEQIGPLFVGFQNDLYEPQNASGNLISRRINGLIRLLILHARPAVDQG